MNSLEILNKDEFSRDDIISMLHFNDDTDITNLFGKADEVRMNCCGNKVHLRGIIEISNYCSQDCLYCGLRKSNSNLVRYRMNSTGIIQTAKIAYNLGLRTLVLQSGEDEFLDCDSIAEIISEIKDAHDVAITLSLGERDFDEYKIWKNAGADRYLLKHESANEILYSRYHLNQSLKERVGHLKILKTLGYQIGSGNIIGLPMQTIEDIADDILLCKELDVDMASFSPFIPSPDTPYRHQPGPNIEAVLKVMAVARIVLKNTHIPATTALAVLDKKGRERGLQAGANVIMPNFTPKRFEDKYLIYPRSEFLKLDSLVSINRMVTRLGRAIARDEGHSLKLSHPKIFD